MGTSTEAARRRRGLVRAYVARARWICAALVVAGLALRLWAALVVPPRALHGDERKYWSQATNVLRRGTHGETWQPPGHSYLIAFWRAAFGDDHATVRVANVAAYGLQVAALLSLAGSAARAAPPLAVLCLHPVAIGFTAFFFSELTFFTAALGAAALQGRRGRLAAAAAGALWGASALIRQIGLPLAAIAALREWWARRDRRAALLRLAAAALAFGAVVAPLLAYNYRFFGRPVLSTAGGFNLWAGNNDEVAGPYAWQGGRLGRYRKRSRSFGDNELQREQEATRRALGFIAAEQPQWAFRKTWMGLTHLFEPDNYVLRRLRVGQYGQVSVAKRRWLAAVTLGGELAAIGWGCWFLLAARPSPERRAVVAMVLVVTGIHVFTVAQSRYRFVIGLLPLLLTGARLSPPRRWHLWASAGIALAVLGVAAASPGATTLSITLGWFRP